MSNELSLHYHRSFPNGKIEVISSKPCEDAKDLSLAYTPGVAAPCLEIKKNPEAVYDYTTKGNLVAVVSNGSAVLGLGNIGPLAGKPVMEGKSILFKKFADINAFDIELDAVEVSEVVSALKAIAPTFGGINLEDIKAPECFSIEEKLISLLDIPVFHDDQHGTAIIASAALLNALELAQKKISDVKIIFSGAGSAATATANLFLKLGANLNNIFMTDLDGVLNENRLSSLDHYRKHFARKTTAKNLEELLAGGDVFIGCSAGGVLKKEMLLKMNPNPIIFAMANPTPEIFPQEVYEVRPDAIVATGRSDYPNQVNNVLGFPFIFRAALDTRSKTINTEMKLAAVRAIAQLAKEKVPEEVLALYGEKNLSFGKNYLIPKPFDRRLLTFVTPQIALAAMESKVARKEIADMNLYKKQLADRILKG